MAGMLVATLNRPFHPVFRFQEKSSMARYDSSYGPPRHRGYAADFGPAVLHLAREMATT